MSSIKFYYMPESPPCRTVEMVAKIAGVDLDRQLVNLSAKDHLKEEYLKINPMHKIPFIIDGELKINESRAIAAYLADKYMPSDNTLFSKDPVERARVNELLYIDASALYPAASRLLRPLLFGHSKELDPEANAAFRDVLTYLDARLQNSGSMKYFIGNDLTIADISFAASFTFPEACAYDLSEFKTLSS